MNGRRGALLWRPSPDADRLAVSCGTLRLTYRQLDERAERLARALLHWELGQGVSVAFLAGKCHRVVEIGIAAGRTGSVVVPIEPNWSPTEVAKVLVETKARALFISMEFLPRLEHIGRQARDVDVLPVILTHRPPLGLLSYERLLELGELVPAR